MRTMYDPGDVLVWQAESSKEIKVGKIQSIRVTNSASVVYVMDTMNQETYYVPEDQIIQIDEVIGLVKETVAMLSNKED